MIHLDFLGSTLEGEVHDHRPGDPLIVFRVQYPQGVVEEAKLDGHPLQHIALVRNGSRSNITSTTVEYEVRESGILVLTSWLNLKGSFTTFRFGVKEENRGILLEESAEAHTGHQIKWFLNGEFLDYHPGQTRSLLSPRATPDPEPLSVWDRLGSDSF